MKVFAYYDSSGNIQSLVSANVPSGGGMMLAPKPGIFVAEVEGLAHELKSDVSDLQVLSDIRKKNKVATPTPRCTLSIKRS